MQTQAMQLFAAVTALAICYRERRAFAQVLDEVKNQSSDRSFLDRMVWGNARKTRKPAPVRRTATLSDPLIDRLMNEVEEREQSDETHRGFSGVAFSRMARATVTTRDDDTLI